MNTAAPDGLRQGQWKSSTDGVHGTGTVGEVAPIDRDLALYRQESL